MKKNKNHQPLPLSEQEAPSLAQTKTPFFVFKIRRKNPLKKKTKKEEESKEEKLLLFFRPFNKKQQNKKSPE